MESNKSYSAVIEVARSAPDVFNALSDVTKWWSKDFTGSNQKLHDEFVINHPPQHYSKQKVMEWVPGKKMVWLVTDSHLGWLEGNQKEWTGTKIMFDITFKKGKTVLRFTHKGLVPQKECYALCTKGWDIVIKDWLLHLVTAGTPSREMANAASIRSQHFKQTHNIERKGYQHTIMVQASLGEAMKKISQIQLWWKKDFSGRAEQLNDQFTVPFQPPSFVDFVVSEFVPQKRMVWTVTDCYLPWFQDKKEWNHTQVVFELWEEDGNTRIDFTHIGLTPEVECYDVCKKGWKGHLGDLVNFMNEGKELPE